jgi:orotate phosphoribosyltransferase
MATFGIPVIVVVSLAELMQYMQDVGRSAELERMQAYRERYGV